VKFLVLQHLECEHPGTIAEGLRKLGVEWDTVEVDEGEPIPDPMGYDALLAFGGPMNVDEEEEHPWLVEEKRVIAAAVRAGLPYLGVCLGGQLLARALGARVHRGREPEVGVLEVFLTDAARADTLFSTMPDPIACLQWHDDSFELPDGAALLATSPACRNQAFRWGKAAYGVQFHVEVAPWMADEWEEVPAYRVALDEARGHGGFAALREELEERAAALAEGSEALCEGFLRVVATRGQRDRPPAPGRSRSRAG
jgi:GMP synthase-like glutamine amidotransferase